MNLNTNDLSHDKCCLGGYTRQVYDYSLLEACETSQTYRFTAGQCTRDNNIHDVNGGILETEVTQHNNSECCQARIENGLVDEGLTAACETAETI